MTCTIKWNILNLKQWQTRFANLHRANLLQSYEYARGICNLNNQTARWGLIEINNIEAGLVQITEAGIFCNLFHAIILDRGPLWFNNFGTDEHFRAFCEELNTQFPRRFGRKRRFIPEVENNKNIQKILKSCQFKEKFKQEYKTIWLNLEENEQKIEEKLRKNWKNSLNKAKKSKIQIKWDEKGQFFEWLRDIYLLDKYQKGYDGPSEILLNALAPHFIAQNNMIIGRALINDKPIAAILILCHGSGATYQIGWSSDLGRKHCAHHLLLWNSLSILKNKGIKDFDLGGINDDTAKGVKKFKEGMGGQMACGPGIYT